MFNKIKQSLKQVLQSFDEDIQVKDGDIVYPTLEIGTDVTLSDGTVAPDGNYILSDGTKLGIADGKITDIVTVDKTPESLEDVQPVVTPDVIAQLTDIVNKLSEKVDSLEKQVTEKIESDTEDFNKFSKQVDTLNKVLNKIASQPVEDSRVSKNNFQKDVENVNKFNYKNFFTDLNGK